jgi:hypothetical protein
MIDQVERFIPVHRAKLVLDLMSLEHLTMFKNLAADYLMIIKKFDIYGPETNRSHILYAPSSQFIHKSAEH